MANRVINFPQQNIEFFYQREAGRLLREFQNVSGESLANIDRDLYNEVFDAVLYKRSPNPDQTLKKLQTKIERGI